MLYFKTEIMRVVGHKFGFALPTVLIASVIMLTVLATVVQVVGTSQNALNDQFYTKLAQAAGESGIAMANACTSDTSGDGGIGWSDSSPLMPNTDCTGTAVQSCPAATATKNCYVMPPQTMVNAKISTTFTVGSPTETAAGDALQISAIGETDLLRTSDGLPWRTYKQTVSQRLANTCSPTTADTPGWHQAMPSQAYPSSQPSGWTGPTTDVQTVQASTTGAAADYPGPTWFRKNFNVLSAGSYTLSALADDRFTMYIDGTQVAGMDTIGAAEPATWNATSSATVNLTAGCHSVVIETMNIGNTLNATDTTAAITKTGSSTPLVATDTTWRAYQPPLAYTGTASYFADPAAWVPTATYGTNASGTNWATVSGQNSYAEWVGMAADGGVGKAPATDYAFFLDNHSFTTTAASTGVHVNMNCDDLCYLYLDGQQIGTGIDAWSTVQTLTASVGPGTHQFSLVLGNGGAGQSGFMLSATRDDTGAVISLSDHNWVSNTAWSAGVSGAAQGFAGNAQSYAIDWGPPNVRDTVTNLTTNPSFETKNSSGAPTCSSTGWSGTNATISVVTDWASPTSWDPPSSGDPNTATQGCSLKIAPTAQDSFAVIPGSTGLAVNSTYYVSGTIHIPAKLTGTLYNSDNRYLGLAVIWNNAIQELATAPNAAGTYHLTVAFKLPTGATSPSVRLYDGSNTATDVVEWDNVMMTQGRLPYVFGDGDQGTTSCTSGWKWNGTVGNSTSTGNINAGCQIYQG